MLQVAVTGAGGFIGAAVVDALHAGGASISALLGPPGAPAHSPPPGTKFASCDITDIARLRHAFAGADVVVHAAGPPSVFASLQDPTECVRVHVLGTACVLEAMRAENVTSIVYVSSAEVYGTARTALVDENHPLVPRSPYGAAKVGAEAILTAAAASYGMRGYILRPFSVYGPRMTPASVLGTIVNQARAGDVIRLADLTPVRDYCYVGDLADAVVKACSLAPAGMAVLNVATGAPTSVGELAAAVAAVLQRTFDIRISATEQRAAAMEISRLVGANAAICAALRWTARHDLQRGLRATLAPAKVA